MGQFPLQCNDVQKSGIKDEVQQVEILAFTATYWYCKVTDFLKNLLVFCFHCS